jgi:hypothetical protein
MRFMVIVKANSDTEAGKLPSTREFAEMGNYNEELVKAGVMLAGEGLLQSAKGVRLQLTAGKATVTDGPFAEVKELIAGYWVWQCKSLAEAVEWAKRCPRPEHGAMNLEIRQIATDEDFGDALTPELIEQDNRLRKQSAKNAS